MCSSQKSLDELSSMWAAAANLIRRAGANEAEADRDKRAVWIVWATMGAKLACRCGQHRNLGRIFRQEPRHEHP